MGKATQRRAYIAFQIRPTKLLRLKTSFRPIQGRPRTNLGFYGIQGLVRYQKNALKKLSSDSQYIAVYKFSADTYILLAEIEKSTTLKLWDDMHKSLTTLLGGKTKTIHKSKPNEAIKSIASGFLLDKNYSKFSYPYVVEHDNRFPIKEVLRRYVLTKAVEKAICNNAMDLALKGTSLIRINRDIHIWLYRHEYWLTTGNNLPSIINSLNKEKIQAQKSMSVTEILERALQKEQIRLAWASATSVACANLAAATIETAGMKWVAWIIAAAIFILVYATKPFTRG
jgi:hypothetical protein